jgi:hypothetical protein
VLPEDAIWADAYDTDSEIDVAVTGNRLFNVDEDTDVFDETITVRYCVLYEFECVPYPVRRYIAEAAKYKFARAARRELRLDNGTIREIESDMLLALTAARQYDSDTSNANILDTDANYRVRGNRGAQVR